MISYKNDVDSFVIVSSDSDYWGLISSLPDAHFLVMIEREKCGPDMKEALADSGIFYCYLDDFYSGNSEDIKKNALFKEMYRWIDNSVHLNVNDMFDAAFGDGDELYFEFAVLFMRTYLFMVLVNGVQLLSSSFFTAIGKSLRGALLALTRQTFFLIPLTLLLPLRFGIMGVLLAGPVADFSAFVLSVVLVGIELKKQKNSLII